MIRYNWQRKDWPSFTYALSGLEGTLSRISGDSGKIEGLLTGLPEPLRWQTLADTMVLEAMKTAEIEGEYLDRASVISSVKANLGMAETGKPGKRKSGQAMGELMIRVRESFLEILTEETLFGWHRLVMASENISIATETGQWRTHEDAMQIVSGPLSHRNVSYEAPPSPKVPDEMKGFIAWFNRTGPGGKEPIHFGPVRAAVAHLYFESIHPFEDGNGRVGRAVAEKALSQGMGRPVLLSLSAAISANRNEYYEALETAQQSLDITKWVKWFSGIVLQAQSNAARQIEFTLKKTQFFDAYKTELNPRQLSALERMWEAGPEGFTGGMNVRKYVGITKTSKATATRDLQDLAQKKILNPSGSARATSYHFPV